MEVAASTLRDTPAGPLVPARDLRAVTCATDPALGHSSSRRDFGPRPGWLFVMSLPLRAKPGGDGPVATAPGAERLAGWVSSPDVGRGCGGHGQGRSRSEKAGVNAPNSQARFWHPGQSPIGLWQCPGRCHRDRRGSPALRGEEVARRVAALGQCGGEVDFDELAGVAQRRDSEQGAGRGESRGER